MARTGRAVCFLTMLLIIKILLSMSDCYDLLERAIDRAGSQRKFAKLVGADEPTISRIRKKLLVPNLRIAIAMQERAGIPAIAWKRVAEKNRRAA